MPEKERKKNFEVKRSHLPLLVRLVMFFDPIRNYFLCKNFHKVTKRPKTVACVRFWINKISQKIIQTGKQQHMAKDRKGKLGHKIIVGKIKL